MHNNMLLDSAPMKAKWKPEAKGCCCLKKLLLCFKTDFFIVTGNIDSPQFKIICLTMARHRNGTEKSDLLLVLSFTNFAGPYSHMIKTQALGHYRVFTNSCRVM